MILSPLSYRSKIIENQYVQLHKAKIYNLVPPSVDILAKPSVNDPCSHNKFLVYARG